MVKNLPAMQETQVWFLCQEDPPKKQMAIHSTPISLPRKSHGQRSLVGYSPWACRESDMTEHVWLSNWAHTHTRVFVKCMNLSSLFFNISTFNKDWRQLTLLQILFSKKQTENGSKRGNKKSNFCNILLFPPFLGANDHITLLSKHKTFWQ